MTVMRVVDIRTCPHGEQQPMVLLEDHACARWLSFYLPLNEANRLARVLHRTSCSVVPVFDLMEKVLKAAGMDVLRAEIGGDERGVSASLVISTRGWRSCFPVIRETRWPSPCGPTAPSSPRTKPSRTPVRWIKSCGRGRSATGWTALRPPTSPITRTGHRPRPWIHRRREGRDTIHCPPRRDTMRALV